MPKCKPPPAHIVAQHGRERLYPTVKPPPAKLVGPVPGPPPKLTEMYQGQPVRTLTANEAAAVKNVEVDGECYYPLVDPNSASAKAIAESGMASFPGAPTEAKFAHQWVCWPMGMPPMTAEGADIRNLEGATRHK